MTAFGVLVVADDLHQMSLYNRSYFEGFFFQKNVYVLYKIGILIPQCTSMSYVNIHKETTVNLFSYTTPWIPGGTGKYYIVCEYFYYIL